MFKCLMWFSNQSLFYFHVTSIFGLFYVRLYYVTLTQLIDFIQLEKCLFIIYIYIGLSYIYI